MDYITEKQLKKDLKKFKPLWSGRCKLMDAIENCHSNIVTRKGRSKGIVHPVTQINFKALGIKS